MTQFSNVPPLSGMQSVSEQQPKTSGMAISSLVLGILGLCTGGVLSLIGIPLGIVALGRISKQPEQLRGKGLAVAGIAVSSITLVVGCLSIFVGLMLPALGAARQSAMAFKDQTMIKIVGQQIMIYASDHNDAFPPPGDWVSALSQDNGDITPLITSALRPNDGRAYAMNANLVGKRYGDVGDPSRTVVLFEAARGSPMAGTSDLMTDKPRSRMGFVVLFADGHVELVMPEGLSGLRWEP